MAKNRDMCEPIAVVGYSYRAPGVGRKDLLEFLAEARSAWSQTPASRFNHEAYYHPDQKKAGFISSRGAHFLPGDIYEFDAAFFNLMSDEARQMDPQHRLILECAFEAIENAGIDLAKIAGTRTGVFASIDPSDYNFLLLEDARNAQNKYTALGTNSALFANRTSHFFQFTGPSIAVDAACAGSSTALHLACQSLRLGECNAALVSGSKLINSPVTWSSLDTLGVTSAEGRCFSYDSRASGFGRGEGAASVMIKRLSDAVADGDAIRGIIRHTTCGHSGSSKGITTPSPAAQMDLLRRLHSEIGLDPNDTTFVEGHGTGTSAGDRAEAEAFAAILASKRTHANPLYMGSLKSNFGHLEGASGIFSLIKGLLMVENDILLPNADFREMTPGIRGGERLKVLQQPIAWPSYATKRICLTNYGFGGSNAAILLEPGPQASLQPPNVSTGEPVPDHHAQAKSPAYLSSSCDDAESPQQRLFVFSAKSLGSLERYLASFSAYIQERDASERFLQDLAFTLGQRRTHFPCRVAIAADRSSFKQKILGLSAGAGLVQSTEPCVAFAFTGQGAQYAQMATGLRRHNAFVKAIHSAESYLKEFGAVWSLTEEIYRSVDSSRVDNVEISQPACTAIQLAIIDLLRAWGVISKFVVGHSSGEIAAAYAAGILSFRTALGIAYHRGIAAAKILRDDSLKGAMLAVGACREDAAALLAEHLTNGEYATIAAVNSPGAVTLSGDESAICILHKAAEAKGLFVRRVNVSVAYHSRHMESVSQSYLSAIEPLCSKESKSSELLPGSIFLSSVTGQRESRAPMNAEYWVQNLTNPVLYSDAIQGLFTNTTDSVSAPNIIIEIGPHPALKNPTKQILASLSRQDVAKMAYLPSLVRDTSADVAMLALAGSLYQKRVEVKLEEVNRSCYPSSARVLTDLPAYEWSKMRLECLPRIAKEKLFGGRVFDDLLGWESPYAEGRDRVFRNLFSLDDLPWVRDHNIGGEVLFPSTAFEALMIRALKTIRHDGTPTVHIREFNILRALPIDEEERIDITTRIRPMDTGLQDGTSATWMCEVMTFSDKRGWITHCHGYMEQEPEGLPYNAPVAQAAIEALTYLKRHDIPAKDPEAEYAAMRESGLRYGTAFRMMTAFWEIPHDSDILVQELQIPASGRIDAAFADACLHLANRIAREEPRPMCIPTHAKRVRVSSSDLLGPGSKATCVVRLDRRDVQTREMELSYVVLAHHGPSRVPVRIVEGLTFKCIARPDALLNAPVVEHWSKRYMPLADTRPQDVDQSKDQQPLELDVPITICGVFHTDAERQFGQLVAGTLEYQFQRSCTIQSIDDLDLSDAAACVFIDSPYRSIFSDLTSMRFDNLQSLFLDASAVLWIVPDKATPEASFAGGFLRTLRLEDPLKGFLLLQSVPASAEGVKGIGELAKRLLDNDEAQLCEQEFLFEDDMIKVPRLEKMLEPAAPNTIRAEQPIVQNDAALEMSVDAIGDPDSIYFRQTDLLEQDLDVDSIIVQVQCSGVNFRDLLLVLGSMPWHPPGLEGAGIVHRIGANVKDLSPGDRVMYITMEGGHANFVRVPACRAYPIPSTMTFPQAAALPIAFTTAIMCLERIGRLSKGESVLIHAATGAVGQACIMIARHIGARIFATAGSVEKRKFLQSEYAIPGSHIFSSRDTAFRDGILSATHGKGVDVVVNSLSGNLLQATWELIAEFGRFVEIGKKDLLQNSSLGMRPFARNVLYAGVDCRELFRNDSTLVRPLFQEIFAHFEAGSIHPISPVTELPITKITQGLRKLQAGQNIGKIVLTMGDNDMVVANCKPLSPCLSADKTYVITGGTGGIGRGLAKWLAEQGARFIVLLGRSGDSSPKVAELLKQYEGTAVHLRAIACDAGVREQVESALQQLEREQFPPVRGVIHGAFVLKDAMFLNASYDDWEAITRPKIQGAWNMHHLCPDLDFFVVLASAAGAIGHFGQSIYAGTTTFLDALCEYRIQRGMPAVSISLPAVAGIGVVAERNMGESIAASLGALLPECKVYEEVSAAIVGPPSGIVQDAKSLPLVRPPRDGPAMPMEWQKHNLFTALREAHGIDISASATESSLDGQCTTVETLVEGLRTKISNMTMLDVAEVAPERDLQDFGLDSLASGELRLWIKKFTGVDLSLIKVVGSKHVEELAETVMKLRA